VIGAVGWKATLHGGHRLVERGRVGKIATRAFPARVSAAAILPTLS
jgi:hypothetical protein